METSAGPKRGQQHPVPGWMKLMTAVRFMIIVGQTVAATLAINSSVGRVANAHLICAAARAELFSNVQP